MKEVSAFVCLTPLQSAIARKIIEEQRITDYVLMNINPHDQPVTRHYFEKIAQGAIESDYVVANSRIFGNYQKISHVLGKWRRYRITDIYLAAIDGVWFQYVIHRHPDAKIYTFDDGVINLIAAGQYHTKTRLSQRHRIPYFLLRRHKDQDWIKRFIVKHFTIYKDVQNIVEAARLHHIALFDDIYDTPVREGAKKSVKVFVGFDLSPRYFSAVRTINPDIYLPHPMEHSSESWLNYVSTNLIAEEFLAGLLADFEFIELYACFSSVLLNVRSPRIQKFVVDLHSNTSEVQKEFNLLAGSMGCKILSFAETGQEQRPVR